MSPKYKSILEELEEQIDECCHCQMENSQENEGHEINGDQDEILSSSINKLKENKHECPICTKGVWVCKLIN